MQGLCAIRMSVWGIALAVAAAASGDVKIEERVVGPVGQDAKYVVSPRGGHVAVAARKGSRMVVVVDGVEGPKFDEIITPTAQHVDLRPLFEAMRAGATQWDRSPVTFSKDGTRHAYVGRLGEEWVLMADGKEVVRIPIAGTSDVRGPVGTSAPEIRIELTGDDGKHLMFARSVFGGHEMWVDGQKMPALFLSGGGGSEGMADPIISRDGARFAYLGVADKKRILIVDGKDAGYIGQEPQFSADGKVLYSIARDNPNENVLLVDGKPDVRASRIVKVYVPPAGNRLVTVAAEQSPDGMQKYFCIVDGKKVDATESASIPSVVQGPDGQHYAAACRTGNKVAFVVIDGKKGQQYDAISQPDVSGVMAFSPDSSKLAYIAFSGNKYFVVVNEQESDAFDSAAVVFLFSPDGKRVACCGTQQSPSSSGFTPYIDGKAERLDRQVNFGTFTFSPDGSSYAYCGQGGAIYRDGKPVGLAGECAFSPDGKHFAVLGEILPADAGPLAPRGRQGLFLNGQFIREQRGGKMIRLWAFTPDSQHLFWLADEPNTNSAENSLRYVAYLDGKPVTRFDRLAGFDEWLLTRVQKQRIVGSFGVQVRELPPALAIASDGVLNLVGPAGDAIKRFKVTPTADTSVATMVAAAQAETAQTAADEVKQAEDQKAAKEKAGADRKAAIDKAIADKQADYEKRMAERKAAQEKALAERKAAKEKAAAEKAAKKAGAAPPGN